MSNNLLKSSIGSIGSVESVVYGGITSNIVKNIDVEAIEEVKEDDQEESAAKKFEKDREEVDEDAFFDELDQDVIDEGVTTNKIQWELRWRNFLKSIVHGIEWPS